MGWLDNSTNNIILDAVLTDYGRQALARNNGSFNISKFALGDDEVNYGTISKYGRTIGREKIEKNTPVFEAFTNQNLALKYKLISIPVPLVFLPALKLTSQTGTINLSASTSGVTTTKSITVSLEKSDVDSMSVLEPTIADAAFDIFYPSLFFTISSSGQTTAQTSMPSQTSMDSLRTALITVPASSTSTSRSATFNLNLRTLSSTIFTTYGRLTSDGKTTISTSIKVVGQNSGQVLDIPIDIQK